MCKQWLPCTNEFFSMTKKATDGFHSRCKKCRSKSFKQSYDEEAKEKAKEKYYDNIEKEKMKAKIYRGKNKDKIKERRKQYDKENKEKVSRRRKEYRLKNHEKVLQRQAQYRANNKEKIRLSRQIYYKNNSEKVKEKAVEYLHDHLEENKQRNKEYYKNNNVIIKEKVKKYSLTPKGKEIDRVSSERRRTLKKQLPATFTLKQWNECKEYFNHSCAYCGKPMKRLEQEHFIPLNKGGEYTKNNILPSCKSCNSSKHAQNFFTWYSRQAFYSKEREEKILKYLNYNKNKRIQQLSIL